MKSLSIKDRQRLAKLLLEGRRLPKNYASHIIDLEDQHLLIWENKTQNCLPHSPHFELTEQKTSSSNTFFVGDNAQVLAELNTSQWQKKISDLGGLKLIYIDPPFDVGSVFHKNKNSALKI